VGQRILVPLMSTFFNHTIVFLVITFGICKNTLGKDLSLRDCHRLMPGRRLPTFSKACYIMTMGFAVVTIAWFYVWLGIEPSSAFRIVLAPGPLYVVLVKIMICRVFRNTILGSFSKVPVLQSNDSTSESHIALDGSISWNSRHETSDVAVTDFGQPSC